MKQWPLHKQIILAMVLGSALGIFLNLMSTYGHISHDKVMNVARVGEWFGNIFLTLLKMVVVPLIFSSLVCSITGLGSKGLGRLGFRSILYYLSTSCLAVLLGLLLVNLIRPGDGLDYSSISEVVSTATGASVEIASSSSGMATETTGTVLADLVNRMIPENIVKESSSNRSILAVIFFAIFFGVAAVRTGAQTAAFMDKIFRSIYDVMITMVHVILKIAPIGIFGYIFFVTASTGYQLILGLIWYMLTVFLALCIHAFVTLPCILWFVGKRDPRQFAKDMSEALLTAFSTASSAATLPLTMKCASENAKVNDKVVSFTLPLGATVNMDGTALYEAIAVLFVAQMLGDLTLAQQFIVAFTALLVSIGAAGIPHAGTVMMVIIMQAVGLPTESVLIILAVDRVLDMCRTTVNVWGDSVGAAVIAHFETESAESHQEENPQDHNDPA